eukprot:CAMPEP_0114167544 /NCGR_PEP_ID=MMETSP0043_2-20121206/32477_1 /TAXON_ID=464988 /ORGANISM="Hemiselmis andersenii, Strain CCMP644" /LENGTH=33 /DNA_ID= /DNA_START= /DNA_END= /DNA_ORIENTATION=
MTLTAPNPAAAARRFASVLSYMARTKQTHAGSV